MLPDPAPKLPDPVATTRLAMTVPYEHSQSNHSTDSLGQPYQTDSTNGNSGFMPSPLSGIAQKKRRTSKTGMPSVIKRSASTPNVRGQSSADAAAAAASLAEKRRNKLGYHRTSVACGHCRRRKIRCLPALEDPVGRCSNCIRLKKECVFFPVDQQPPQDRQSRNGSKAGATGSSRSNSPSPGLSHSQTFDVVEDFNNYSPSTSNAPAEFAVPDARHRHGSVSSLGKMSRLQSHGLAHMHTGPGVARHYDSSESLPRSYDPHSADGSSAWNSPFIDQSPASASKPGFEDPASNFWRLAESPMTPAFTTFSGPPSMTAPDSNGAVKSTYPIDSSREDVNWPPPSRSLSFGNVEHLSHGYPPPFPYRAPEFVPAPAQNGKHDLYPHPIITSGHPVGVGAVSAPTSAPVDGKPLATGYGLPQWGAGYLGNNINDVSRKPAPGYNGWYGEPGPLAQVEEEAVGSHYGEDPAIFYPPATAQTRG